MTHGLLYTLLFSVLALLAALRAGWLLRQDSGRALVGGVAFALLATGSGFMAWQLHRQAPPPPTIPTYAVPKLLTGHFETIPPQALEQVLLSVKGQPVLLEFYADWCSSCLVWKNQVLNRIDVQAALQPFILLRIDATEMTPETQQALNRFDLAGLPALISFSQDGQELKALRILGEMPASTFITTVQQQILPAATSKKP